MNKPWYIIFSKPRMEEVARKNLENQGFNTYLPMLESIKRKRGKNKLSVEPLFSRYLFIQLVLGVDDISTIQFTCGVSRIISFGQYPTSLPFGFVEVLRDSEDAQKRVHITDNSQIKLGDTIEIMNGPFAGYISKIHAINGPERVCILMDILH